MPPEQQERLAQIVEQVGITSCAWMRANDAWLLRTDTEAGGVQESDLLALLARAGIPSVAITEEVFWKTRSTAF